MPRATIADLDRAKAIILLGVDAREQVPVLHLRLQRAVVELGVPLVDVGSRDCGLTRHATAVLRHEPGAPTEVVARLVDALGGRKTRNRAADAVVDAIAERTGPVVVVIGRPSLAEPADATVHAASLLSRVGDVRFLSALPRGNVHGALDLGLAPGFLPGRVTLDAGRRHVAEVWGDVPSAAGKGATDILRAAAAGEVRCLVLLGCDPLVDFPDRTLARAALQKVERVICVGAFPSDGIEHADVVLPPTVWGEQQGTTTNLEGRVLRLGAAVSPEGATMEAWRIAAELAVRLGHDFDLETVEEVQDEIARVAPAFAGVDAALLRRARDGVVLPLADHVDDLATGPAAPGAGVSWEPIPPRRRRPDSGAGRRDRGATASGRAVRVERRGRATRRRADRRIQSAPRGSSDALRIRSGRRRVAVTRAHRRRDASACSSTHATSRRSGSPMAIACAPRRRERRSRCSSRATTQRRGAPRSWRSTVPDPVRRTSSTSTLRSPTCASRRSSAPVAGAPEGRP